MKLAGIAFVFALFASALTAFARAAVDEANGAEAPLADCIEHSDGTNTAWAVCGGAEVERQEQRLNAAWAKASAQLDPKSRADLLVEQRAWVSFKDKSCLYFANGQWGRQGQVLEFPACRAAIVAERAQYLESLAHDPDDLD